MATQTEKEQLLQLGIGMFGKAFGKSSLDFLETAFDGGMSVGAIAAALSNHDLFTSQFAGKTDAEIAEALIGNYGLTTNTTSIGDITMLTEATNLKAFFVQNLATYSAGELVTIANYALTDASQTAIQAQFPKATAYLANATATASYYAIDKAMTSDSAEALSSVTEVATSVDTAKALIDNMSTVEGETISLTSGIDIKTGTSIADTFEAYLAQNATAGGMSNTLSSADKLDGGAGVDTLFAQLVNEFIGTDSSDQIDVQARTTSIEKIEIEARDNDGVVTLDAKDMTGVTHIGSKNSDGDLVIENLTTLTDAGAIRHTSEMTITMDHTDNFDSDNDAADLTVYFDEDYINQTTSTAGASLTLRMNNVVNIKEGNNPVDGFATVNFTVGTTAVAVDVTGSTSYDDIVTKINAQLTAQGLTSVSAAKATAENVYFSQTTVSGTNTYAANSFAGTFNPIVITNTGSEALTAGTIDLTQGTISGDINNTWNSTSATTTSLPISTNVELEKVGRDGEGGNLVIGGKDRSNVDGDTDVDQNDGIDIFNITVKGDTNKPSNLGVIQSTNAELNTVNIVSETRTDSSYAALTVTGDAAALGNGNTANTAPFGGDLSTLEADAFLGALSIGAEVAAQNIDDIDAAGGGNVTLVHNTTVDGVFTVDTGAGADTITTDIDMSDSAIHTYSNTINTAGGNDTVNLTYSTETATNMTNTNQINQVNVNLGAGDDTLNLGSGDTYSTVQADLGAGNDTFIVSNDATKSSWIYNADASGASYIGRGDVEHKVFKLKLAVEFQGLETQWVTVSYDTATYTTDSKQINDAIKSAIANDAVLSKLLSTSDLRDNGLQITSLVDRDLNNEDLNIKFLAPKYTEHDATGDADSTLEQADNAQYANDSDAIFTARLVTSQTEIESAWAAWYSDSDGGSNANYDSGTGIYSALTAASTTLDVYNAMFDAADSDDVNSSREEGGVDTATFDDIDNDENMQYTDGASAAIATSYNKLGLVTNGLNGTDISISKLTGSAGDDLFVLNSNNAAGAGFETLVLTESFGTDTILNYNTGNVAGTADVIDYSVFLDATAAARGTSADAAYITGDRDEMYVAYTFQNLVTAEAANDGSGDADHLGGIAAGSLDHNQVLTIEFSDIYSSLNATQIAALDDFSDLTAEMVDAALEAQLVDTDFENTDPNGGGAITEDDHDGTKFVVNVVYDRQIEKNAAGTNVLGDNVDYATQTVFSVVTAFDGTSDSANDLTFTVTEQGTLNFADMYSTIADLTDTSVAGTANQTTAAATELTRIDTANKAADQNANIVVLTDGTLTSTAVGAGTDVFTFTGSDSVVQTNTDTTKVYIGTGNTVTYGTTAHDEDNDLTIVNTGTLQGTAANFTGDHVDITGDVSISALANNTDLTNMAASGTVSVALAGDLTLAGADLSTATNGTVNVAVASGQTLTTTTANLNTLDADTISGAGTVDIVATAAQDLTGATEVADLAKVTTTTYNLIVNDSSNVTITAAQKNAFDNIYGDATAHVALDGNETINIDTLTGATVASTTAVDSFSFADADTSVSITGFTQGTDKLTFTGMTEISGTGADQATGATKVADATDGEVYVFASSNDNGPDDGANTIASFTDTADVAAFLEGALTSASAEDYIAIINDAGNAGTAYIYHVNVDAVDTTTNQIDGGDITLIGSVVADSAILAADIA